MAHFYANTPSPSAQPALPTERWVPLMEYAIKNGVSLSTLRRHIKAKKITYRLENGRYLILQTGIQASAQLTSQAPKAPTASAVPVAQASPSFPLSRPGDAALEAELLRAELQRAHEEIAELKTLIALYEETAKTQFQAEL